MFNVQRLKKQLKRLSKNFLKTFINHACAQTRMYTDENHLSPNIGFQT